MKNKINLTKLICIAVALFLTAGCNDITSKRKGTDTNSTENVLKLPFSQMTVTYQGRANISNELGQLIFERNKIIISSGGHKEWFKINSVAVEPKSIRFSTKNSKEEDALFSIIINGKIISQIETEMFGVSAYYALSNDTLSGSHMIQFYSDMISTSKPGRYIETKRDDGVISKMYEPLIVAEIEGMQIALTYTTSQVGNYISVILRFEDKIRMMDGILALRLCNDELLRFEPEKIQKTNFGHLDGVIGLYSCSKEQSAKLMQNNITNVTISFKDGALSTYNVNSNSDVLSKQTKLLHQ
tara:strand:- start:20942 stop:21838 length:897 start_codon:yes stop_codon:yes gene_type:complete